MQRYKKIDFSPPPHTYQFQKYSQGNYKLLGVSYTGNTGDTQAYSLEIINHVCSWQGDSFLGFKKENLKSLCCFVCFFY